MPLKNGRTTAALQTIVVGTVIPSGTIAPFGGGTVPSGWLLCDGSVASRTTYASLFSSVGIVNGQGDGSTTFHLPDLRGRFIRGSDNMGTGAAGRDPGDSRSASNIGGANGVTVGSVQDEAYLSHTHRTVAEGSLFGTEGANVSAGQFYAYRSNPTALSSSRGGTETRPKNANVNYIIKV